MKDSTLNAVETSGAFISSFCVIALMAGFALGAIEAVQTGFMSAGILGASAYLLAHAGKHI